MRKKWFFILKLGITAISFLLVILAKSEIDWTNLSNNYINPVYVKEIIYDLAIGIFSAMILVWFIDEIGNQLQERESVEKEKAAIKRFDRVLQKYIEKYTLAFYCVATPIDIRKFDNVVMPDTFTLKDMRDLHRTTLLMREKVSGGSVEAFLQIEYDIRREFISLIEKHELEHFPQFSQIFLEFIDTSLSYDSRAAILDAPKACSERFIHDLLENNADDYYQKILNGENIGGNLAHPYMFLYEMMRKERVLILRYQEEISKLD